MAAKKPKKPASMTEALGIKNIFGNEKLIFVIGIVILAVAIYFLIAYYINKSCSVFHQSSFYIIPSLIKS